MCSPFSMWQHAQRRPDSPRLRSWMYLCLMGAERGVDKHAESGSGDKAGLETCNQSWGGCRSLGNFLLMPVIKGITSSGLDLIAACIFFISSSLLDSCNTPFRMTSLPQDSLGLPATVGGSPAEWSMSHASSYHKTHHTRLYLMDYLPPLMTGSS